MRALVDRVARAMRALAPQGGRVVAAVSGGPDSVAMTHLLRRLTPRGRWDLAAVAHFNHRLRGADADADEAFCGDLARELGVPFFFERADVAAEASAAGRSIEEVARRLRYAFLERARLAAGADLVAVGHTRDDQAETILLRLFRGAGPRGLGGIHRRHGHVIRPLLDIRRSDLHAWLVAEGHPYRIDATNADTSIPRNRIRHELLPTLEQFSPGATESLARAAAIAGEDDDFLARCAAESAATVVLSREGRLTIDRERLTSLHPAVARRVVRDALSQVAPGRFIALAHVEAVLDLAGGTLDLPGQTVTRRGTRLVLAPAGRRPTPTGAAGSNVFRHPLSIPGEVEIPECGLAISAQRVEPGGSAADTVTDGVRVRARGAIDGWAVRNRRAGDRFRPPGVGGRKKLQDYFVDRKVPRDQRDRVPLVVDAEDRIVWVVGHAVADDFRNPGSEEPVLLLKVRQLGEPV
jgi:tRNA(Ile)-lysidine synthase